MSTAAIVPIKDLDFAKTRLNRVLSLRDRRALMLDSLRRVLDALTNTPEIQATYVVTPDARAISVARACGATPLFDTAEGLNLSLDYAIAQVERRGPGACLVVLGDLPLLEPSNITEMLALGDGYRGVVAAPDRDHDGTNALLLRPPGVLRPMFGRRSFDRFRTEAESRDIPFTIYESAQTAFDVDEPDDLLELWFRGQHSGLVVPEYSEL